MKLSEVAESVGGDLTGDGSVDIKGVASLEDAKEGDIAFLADGKCSGSLELSEASAFILPPGVRDENRPFITSENPLSSFSKVVNLFHPLPAPKGIDPRAVVEKGTKLGDDVTLYPNVYIGEGVVLGDRVAVYPGAYVGAGSRVDDDTIIYANVVINDGTEIGKRVIIHGGAILGSDGYGFVWDGKKHLKIPQVGRVVIGDDVEIGANTTIDRATLGKTEIKRGTKIDNLVHIAHNCTVGEDSIIIAQTGLAGSVDVGRNVIISGQVAVTDHVKVGDGAMIGGKSGVTKDVPAGEKVTGYPHMPVSEWLRVQKVSQSLPDMRKQLKALQNKMEKMENSDA